MDIHVRKYGGSSVATAEQINQICNSLPKNPIVIVLSAPFGRTAQLYEALSTAKFSAAYNHLIALGEQESCLKFKVALEQLGREVEIVSYTQAGIEASQSHGGSIVSCSPRYIKSRLLEGKSVIVAGFQGLYKEQLAILARGSSDDTAVALSIGLGCPCHIYSNVPYIFNYQGQQHQSIYYDTLLNMITEFQAPMSRSSVLMAKAYEKEIWFGRWDSDQAGTIICQKDLLHDNLPEEIGLF